MGKNLTIYLPENVAKKMEKFSEVNWSEICRKAVADYVDTRSEIELTPILERLKKERSGDFKQGQLIMYAQIIPKMAWKDFEFLYPRLNKTIIKESPAITPFSNEEILSDETAERVAIREMSFWLQRFGKECGAKVPQDFSDAYAEGAIKAFRDVYNKIKYPKFRMGRHAGK